MSDPAPPVPFLVAIEGIDGAGKTTVARELALALQACGIPLACSKEPTQGEFGRRLRATAATGRLSPEAEVELLLLDRKAHVAAVIGPALKGGSTVILDRYYFSNAAYQGAEGLDPDHILALNEAFAPRADLVLLLDVPSEVGLARIHQRGDFANRFEQPETLARCREIFLSIQRPEIRIVDGTRDFVAVFEECMQRFVAAFSAKASKIYGVSVDGARALQPLFRGAFREIAA